MKTILSLGLITLLPVLAIFTLVYFAIHGARRQRPLQSVSIPATKPIAHKTVSLS